MKRKPYLVLLFKILIFFGVLLQLGYLFYFEKDFSQRFIAVFSRNIRFGWLLLVFLLMFLNWLIEAVKWQFLVRKITEINLSKAIEVVLTGLSFGFFTPRGVGDYIARVYVSESSQKISLVMALLLSRMSQLAVILVGGAIGLLFFKTESINFTVFTSISISKWVMAILAIILVVIISLWFYKATKVTSFFALLKRRNVFGAKDIGFVSLLSVLRYLTYTTQFVLLLMAIGVTVPFLTLLITIFVVFLAKAMLPVFNFMSDIGVREVFAVLFLSTLGVPEEVALVASLMLWGINILLPTLFGVLITLKMKL